MDYFDFNIAMERGDTVELLRCANNCNTQQSHIEAQIADLKAKLDEQRNFEHKLRNKANKI